MKGNYKNLILQKITGLSKEQLFLSEDIFLNTQQQSLYHQYMNRIASGEPIEYILKHVLFFSLDFYVDNRVLIPRDDTEVMIEQVCTQRGNIYIDIGTGSGCIAISVVKNSIQKFERVYALDLSRKALEVATINITNHNLEQQIKLGYSDLLEELFKKDIQGKQIIITANLPYIKKDDFENMDESVYVHEPKLALYGGDKTGFELYERLILQCEELTKPGNKIILFIEIGFDQIQVCKDFLQLKGFYYEIFKDNGGIERCIKIDI